MATNNLKGGKLLREYRNAANLNRDELADFAGCSPTHVTLIENGRRLPGTDDLVTAFANACGRQPEDLLAAFAHDRAIAWMKHMPEHLAGERAEEIRRIAVREQEPVAA